MQYKNFYFKNKANSYYLCQPQGYVIPCIYLFICWLVSKTTQKVTGDLAEGMWSLTAHLADSVMK